MKKKNEQKPIKTNKSNITKTSKNSNIKSKKVNTKKVDSKKNGGKNIPIVDKISKFIKNNIYDIVLAILSIIALIIGTVAIGFKKSIIIVLAIDIIIWFLPVVSFIGNKSKRKIKRRTFAQVFLWIVIAGLMCCIGFALFIVIKSPEFNPNNLYKKEATVVYDKDGAIIAKLGSQMREKVTYEELPEVLVDAIVATEDSQFFEHNGFNPARFLKASLTQVLGHGGGGASTITMQVSKNSFTSFESQGIDGIIRKFTDIYLSIFKIEKNYTKEQILEFYVNSYYMGGGAWGVEQACQNYFGKSVSEINLSEAALIAGLFKGGYAYDPYLFPENAEARRKVVLGLMQRHGYITEEEKNLALELTVSDILVTDRKSESYQAFIDTVVEEVKKKTKQNPYSVPMEIYTTMDTKKQEYVNKVMESNDKNLWRDDVVQAGIAITDTNTGAVVAIGAGRNRKGVSTFNYATMINNQIGSTAKPLYDYGPAIEYNNYSPASPIVDEPHSYSNGIGMNNWDGRYFGYITFRNALVASRNVPALKIFQNLKNSNIKNFVSNLGLHPQIENGIVHEAHSIGGYNGESPLSMAAAYAAFANGGTYIEPYSFTKVVYRETGEEYVNTYETKKAMSSSTAYMITSMLIDGAVYNTGSSSANGVKYTTKTGTTNFDGATISRYKLPSTAVNDLWAVGYSRDYSMAIWYGYDHITSTHYNRSDSSHTRLFRKLATGVFTGTKDFNVPSDVVRVEIEKGNAEIKLPSEYTPDNLKTTEYFKAGTEPTEVSTRFAKLSDISNLNANNSGSTISLNWTAINTPLELDSEALTNEFKKVFYTTNMLDSFVDARIKENAQLLGEIEYEIYLKNNSGEYELVGKTTDNTFEYNASRLSNGTMSFKVKTTYSIFKNNASDGKEVEITINNVQSLITSNINGQETVEISLNSEFEEPSKPVIVQEDLIDVTDNASITRTITDSTGSVVKEIDTSVEEIYTVTYKIIYKNYSSTLTKTIIVK